MNSFLSSRSALRLSLAALTLSTTLVGCGETVNRRTGAILSSVGSGDANGDGIAIELALAPAEPAGTALRQAIVASFVFRLECDGIEPQTVTTDRYVIFGSRTNCLAKLNEFTLDSGEVYRPKTPFQTFMAPEKTAYQTADGGEVMVAVEQQLPPVIDKPSSVRYSFTELKKGENRTIAANRATFSVAGELAPALALVQSDYDYKDFILTYECERPLVGTTLHDADCAGDKLDKMMLLAEPLADLVELDFLTSELLGKLFASSGRTLAALKAKVIKPGEAGLANGGFQIKVAPVNAGSKLPGGISAAYLFGLAPKEQTSFLVNRVSFDVK